MTLRLTINDITYDLDTAYVPIVLFYCEYGMDRYVHCSECLSRLGCFFDTSGPPRCTSASQQSISATLCDPPKISRIVPDQGQSLKKVFQSFKTFLNFWKFDIS